jgi:2-deoxy-D-gluconate 3-dehydrogenase
MVDELEGKVAFVTGGSGGMGIALATAFARAGASVVVADLPERTPQVERVLQALPTGEHSQAQALAASLDVREPSSIRAAIAEAVSKLGRLDIIVCNAGLNIRKSSLEVTEADWDGVLDVNLRGVFFSAQAAAAEMVREQHGGKVVSIASIMGLVGSPFGHAAAYCASKAGVVNLTRTLAVEWASYGITVNAVAPTYVPTPLTEQLLANAALLQGVLDRTPMGKLASTESVADAVVFLASPRADMITGVTLPVDCGWTAW